MNILVSASLALLFAIGLGLAAAGGIRAAWRGLGRRRGVSAALAAFAVVATICAQKPGPSGPTITIDALLRDAGCYATNDVFHAAVSNAPAYAGINFSACPVLVYARERGQTAAADWFELTPRRTFSALPADYAIANATNYNYMVYLDYVPPSPVHTNGVFELRGFVVPGDEPGNLEQLAAGFINSRAILPPPTARDYVQDGLIAMWDGIENAGWGVHDPNATVWKDLTGNHVLSYEFTPSFTDNAFELPGINKVAHCESNLWRDAVNSNQCTVEICFKGYSFGGNNSIIALSVGIASNTERAWWQWGNVAFGYRLSSASTWSKDTLLPRGETDDVSLSFPLADMYMNGTRVVTGSPGTLNIQSKTLVIGRIGSYTSRINGFVTMRADIHSIRIYNKVLTAEEIAHNYKIDKERFNLP